MATPQPVIVVGAGPVGLCLALALAQDGIAVTLIEQLSDDKFLDQVPRAGSNHPATLELFDRIGLYEKLVPRGIIAPKFHYWDRQHASLIAEFDHIHLKERHALPVRPAMRAHQDHRGGAGHGQGAPANRGAHGDDADQF